MRQILLSIIIIPVVIILLFNLKMQAPKKEIPENKFYTIAGIVQPKETLEAIFSKYRLDNRELSEICQSAKKKYNLSKISVGNIYSFTVDKEGNTIQRMQYGINDMSFLDVEKKPEGFFAEKINIQTNKKTGYLCLDIKDNLILSMPGTHKEYHRLALDLSDIFAWDIDFFNDIRNGDSVKIIVEELWVGEVFTGYGNILAAEFINNGRIHTAYRFEQDRYKDYYDRNGKSMKKSLLRSPLKFKYISSRFSRKRFHPKLRTYRQHLGIDYAAPTGTPVSAAGSGTLIFAGYKGQNGKMVKIKHQGGYVTYYGHLSRIPGKIRRGVKVSQGDIIGYVGSTGLATGPHLDYRIKLNGKFVNPLKIRLPRGKAIPKKLMAEFKKVVNTFDSRLVSITQPVAAFKEKKKTSG
jgi:murein DD-endopeptidase MepM/ murein hydrolase activator NlpD